MVKGRNWIARGSSSKSLRTDLRLGTSGCSMPCNAGDSSCQSRQKFFGVIQAFYALRGLPDCQINSSIGVKLIPRMNYWDWLIVVQESIFTPEQVLVSFFLPLTTVQVVVIGETTVIGDHVKIYQGVRSVALSVEKLKRNTKSTSNPSRIQLSFMLRPILGRYNYIGKNSVLGRKCNGF